VKVIQNYVLELWILWKKNSQTFWKYVGLQSQTLHVNRTNFKRGVNIFKDNVRGVQVVDIEQESFGICLEYGKIILYRLLLF
jgi:hypothetical protein